MRRVVKWASTCANQTSGSDGQNGGSLTDTLATAAVAVEVAGVTSATCSSSDRASASRQGHQCSVDTVLLRDILIIISVHDKNRAQYVLQHMVMWSCGNDRQNYIE